MFPFQASSLEMSLCVGTLASVWNVLGFLVYILYTTLGFGLTDRCMATRNFKSPAVLVCTYIGVYAIYVSSGLDMWRYIVCTFERKRRMCM